MSRKSDSRLKRICCTSLKVTAIFLRMIYLKQLSSTRHRDPYQGLIPIDIELVFLVIISFSYCRNLCGFLNTGAGGVVYCGVTDNGEVQGIHLTNYQKDHVLLSIQDLFSRFEPPVDSSMYTVHFVPVVTENDHVPDIPSFPVDPEQRNTPHILRTSKYCW